MYRQVPGIACKIKGAIRWCGTDGRDGCPYVRTRKAEPQGAAATHREACQIESASSSISEPRLEVINHIVHILFRYSLVPGSAARQRSSSYIIYRPELRPVPCRFDIVLKRNVAGHDEVVSLAVADAKEASQAQAVV
ncbi:MAG: hypothetical protein MZV63_66965 [Marinilabiliales bacterium]|nr:hypothetical protein [Marinilabiliales bacterium]